MRRVLGAAPPPAWRGLLALVLVVTAGCTVQTAGSPQRESVVRTPATESGIVGAGGGAVDRVAAAALADIDLYWDETFPDLADGDYSAISQVISVDTAAGGTQDVPCVDSPAQVEGNAFYCPGEDTMVYDRAALLPTLAQEHGDAAIVLVLAHEVGHAVHTQLGVTPEVRRADPEAFPTIVTESMSDCYAGAFSRWVVDGNGTHLSVTPKQMDLAVGSLVSFRDPVGTLAQDDGAHGNAFDRVSSFTDGYVQGPELCTEITVGNRGFTQTEFTSQTDFDNGGNLPLADLIDLVEPALATLYTDVSGAAEVPPLVRSADGTCSPAQGPVAVCSADGGGREVVADLTELAAVHAEIGDFASATLLASRYAAAALQVDGRSDGLDTVCLAGVFTRDQSDSLSPGDLDEAVQVLLARDAASRGTDGTAGSDTGLDRVGAFRTGALQGADGCTA